MDIDRAAIFEGLNPEQKQVVEARDGAYLVVAVAGAGKTRAVVHRVANMVANGVDAPSILAVTFSKKAADEMNERLEALGVDVSRDGDGCRVGTWHSLAFEILRAERPSMRKWEVDDGKRYRAMVKIALGFQGMRWDGADLSTVLQFIGRCKAFCAEAGTEAASKIAQETFEGRPCAQTNPRLLCEAYTRAEEAREQRRVLTFDDMLLATWKVLRDDEQARATWSRRFQYVIQDEAQDSNLVQCEIAEYLARSHGNYMIVGDPAQSIYGFRGAVPSKLLAFEKEWNATIIRMARNYRSGATVIGAANGSIRAMDPSTHLGVEMIAERGTDGAVEFAIHDDPDTEGRSVAAQIEALIQDGAEPRDFAVLYRTNAQSRGVEEAMLSARLPYVVVGGTLFYERREVKDLLAYLRTAAVRGDFDTTKRCLNTPFRFLGKAFVERVECEYGGEGDDWIDAVRRTATKAGINYRQKTSVEEWAGVIESIRVSMTKRDAMVPEQLDSEDAKSNMPAAIIERVINDTDYMKFITRDEGSETIENNRVSNIRELVRAAERFTTVSEFLDYVDQVVEQAKLAARDRNANRVTLCSVHRSKGLEWPQVFVIGANERILPHGRAEDLGEERRLFYVAATRARDALRISALRFIAYGEKLIPVQPSRFLSEAGINTATEEGEVAA